MFHRFRNPRPSSQPPPSPLPLAADDELFLNTNREDVSQRPPVYTNDMQPLLGSPDLSRPPPAPRSPTTVSSPDLSPNACEPVSPLSYISPFHHQAEPVSPVSPELPRVPHFASEPQPQYTDMPHHPRPASTISSNSSTRPSMLLSRREIRAMLNSAAVGEKLMDLLLSSASEYLAEAGGAMNPDLDDGTADQLVQSFLVSVSPTAQPPLHLVLMTPAEHGVWTALKQLPGFAASGDWLRPLRSALNMLMTTTRCLELRFGLTGATGEGLRQQQRLEQFDTEALVGAAPRSDEDDPDSDSDSDSEMGEENPHKPKPLSTLWNVCQLEALIAETGRLSARLETVEGIAAAGTTPYCSDVLPLASPILLPPTVSMHHLACGGLTMSSLARSLQLGPASPLRHNQNLGRVLWHRFDPSLSPYLGPEPSRRMVGLPPTALLHRWLRNTTRSPQFASAVQQHVQQMLASAAQVQRNTDCQCPSCKGLLVARMVQIPPRPMPMPMPQPLPQQSRHGSHQMNQVPLHPSEMPPMLPPQTQITPPPRYTPAWDTTDHTISLGHWLRNHFGFTRTPRTPPRPSQRTPPWPTPPPRYQSTPPSNLPRRSPGQRPGPSPRSGPSPRPGPSPPRPQPSPQNRSSPSNGSSRQQPAPVAVVLQR